MLDIISIFENKLVYIVDIFYGDEKEFDLYLKTIKQIANELGVSKQAVHQKRKTKELSMKLDPFTSTVDGVVYISIDGETLIKQAFLGDCRKAVDDNKPSTVDVNGSSIVDGNVYSFLRITIDILKKQLEEKDIQINKKDDQIAMLQKLLDQQQQLQLADKVQNNSLLEMSDEKKSWKFWKK